MTARILRVVQPPSRRTEALLALAGLGALATAVFVAVDTASRRPSGGAVIALGTAVGLGLVTLAYAHFEAFVLVTLAVRTTADWAEASGSDTLDSSGGAATALALLFLATAVFWLVVQQRAGRLRSPSPLAKALLALLAAALLSTTNADLPIVSLTETARIAAAVVMFVVLDQLVADPAVARRVLVACFASAVIPLTVGAVQVATYGGENFTRDLSRVEATFVHPNTFGFYLALLLIMGAALYPHVAGGVRAVLGVGLAVAAVELLFSYSRGSWVAALVGLVVVGALQARKLLLLLAIVAVTVPLLAPSVVVRLSDLDDRRTVGGESENSLTWRLDHWRQTLGLAEPGSVTGLGLNMARSGTGPSLGAHNDYVRMYVEAGVLGLAAYLVVLGTMLGTAGISLRTCSKGPGRGLAVGVSGIVAAFVVDSFGANLIAQVVVLWYVFAFIAAGSCVLPRPAPATP